MKLTAGCSFLKFFVFTLWSLSEIFVHICWISDLLMLCHTEEVLFLAFHCKSPAYSLFGRKNTCSYCSFLKSFVFTLWSLSEIFVHICWISDLLMLCHTEEVLFLAFHCKSPAYSLFGRKNTCCFFSTVHSQLY